MSFELDLFKPSGAPASMSLWRSARRRNGDAASRVVSVTVPPGPAVRAASRSAASGVASRARGRQQPPCAFIVEDDPDVSRALARHLGPELHVQLASNVAQAEVLLGELERLDVAFVDLELPDGSGERILEQLARWPDAIRVLISGRAGLDEEVLKNRTLANIVLRKPVLPHVIEALKRAALALPNG